MTTPFDAATGAIDESTLRQQLQFHLAQGTDNLCILGTTGESATLSRAERHRVWTIAAEECKGEVPILAGTGTINVDTCQAQLQQAYDCGCDAALVVTPYYVKPPQRCLVQHMVDMANLQLLPIVMYNVPGRTGVDMSDESLALACSISGDAIVGVKDATGDVARVQSFQTALDRAGVVRSSNTILTYSGDDATSVDFLAAGGDGCISVTANVAPRAMHELVQAARAGDLELARKINEPLMGLHRDLFCESNPMPAKCALSRMGMGSSFCRKPLAALDPELAPVVDAALRTAGLLQLT